MASNYGNCSFQATSNKFSYDEFVNGRNQYLQIAATASTGIFTITYDFNQPATYYLRSPGVTASMSVVDTNGKQGKITFAGVGGADPSGIITLIGTTTASIAWNNVTSPALTIVTILTYLSSAFVSLQAAGGPNIATVVDSPTDSLFLTQSISGFSGNTQIIVADWAGSPSTSGFSGGKNQYNTNTWSPTTGTITAVGTKMHDSYTLSPFHHGHFFDMISSPPEKYYFSINGKTSPPVETRRASSSYVYSVNQDQYSRIFSRYVDGEETAAAAVDSFFTELE